MRPEIFKCLESAYGGDVALYTRMWHTYSISPEDDPKGEEFEVRGNTGRALNYVLNGFREG